jgi:hypothetical protein
VTRFTDLKAWQRARDLALLVYAHAKAWPDDAHELAADARKVALELPVHVVHAAGASTPAAQYDAVACAHKSLQHLEGLLVIGIGLRYFRAADELAVLRLVDEVAVLLGDFPALAEAAALGIAP